MNISKTDGTGAITLYPQTKQAGRFPDRMDSLTPTGGGGYLQDDGTVDISSQVLTIDGNVAQGDVATLVSYYQTGNDYHVDDNYNVWQVRFDTQQSKIDDNWERWNPPSYRSFHLVFHVVSKVS